MADETNNNHQEVNAGTATPVVETPADFMQSLDNITARLEKGRAVATAARGTVQVKNVAEAAVVTKDNEAEQRIGQHLAQSGNVLSKQFETLLRDNTLRKSLSFLEVDKDALEFPQEFLRKRAPGINGEMSYVMKDWQLEALTQALLVKGNKEEFATPATRWATQGNAEALAEKVSDLARAGNPFGQALSKAMDSSSGSALIRTDLEPLLYEAYRRRFPGDELLPRVKANGLQHSYNQVTDPGAAVTTDELGTTISANVVNATYTRKQSTNIAVLISPRAIGLKLFYAVNQSGMSAFNLGMTDSNLELRHAMRAIADKNQSLVFQGNQTVSSGAGLNTENGANNANDFDGLRLQLKGSTTAITKGSSQTFVDVLDQAVGAVIDDGGDAENTWLWMSTKVRRAINRELFPYTNAIGAAGFGGPVNNNLSANGMITVGEWRSRMINVPANAQAKGIGYYSFDPGSGAAAYEDVYATDPEGLQLAWLGSPTPQILELPTGTTLNLSTLYIPFLMNGLVVRVLPFNRKIRVPQQS
jgi:hypothetical protein